MGELFTVNCGNAFIHDYKYHISIKGISNFFSFPQPGYLSHEDHDLLVSYQTKQRLSVSVHHFSSQVAGLGVYVHTNLFISTTLDRLLLYISLDLSGPGNVVVPIMISDNINHQLLKMFVAVTKKSTHSKSGENRYPLLPILHGPLRKSKSFISSFGSSILKI